jgi:hypothetical protein
MISVYQSHSGGEALTNSVYAKETKTALVPQWLTREPRALFPAKS